jgi:hypothetical protein
MKFGVTVKTEQSTFFDFFQQTAPRTIGAASKVYLKGFRLWLDVVKAEGGMVRTISTHFTAVVLMCYQP